MKYSFGVDYLNMYEYKCNQISLLSSSKTKNLPLRPCKLLGRTKRLDEESLCYIQLIQFGFLELFFIHIIYIYSL